jgi:hypothetical protein
MCDCIKQHNARLKDSLRRIDATFTLGESPQRVVINTYPTGPSLFTPTPPLIVAEFCPFCGKAYGGVTPAEEEARHASAV